MEYLGKNLGENLEQDYPAGEILPKETVEELSRKLAFLAILDNPCIVLGEN